MRWGFEGMLQLQFRGTRLPISIGNLTVEFDGIKVSNLTLPKNYMVYIHGYHYIKCYALFSGCGDDEHEPVSTVFLLPGAYCCCFSFHTALLSVTKIH